MMGLISSWGSSIVYDASAEDLPKMVLNGMINIRDVIEKHFMVEHQENFGKLHNTKKNTTPIETHNKETPILDLIEIDFSS